VTARVCELLHDLSASACETGAARECLVPLTHYDVASLIGATRQTATSVLNKLERSGIIALGRGWIRVKRLAELQAYAGAALAAVLQVFSCLCRLGDIPLM
jgi:CRP/FNR family cyclic AMP-dependent transcriptional regulator